MKPIYKSFFIFSIILTIAALGATAFVWNKSGGSFLSIDFRGGSLMEVSFEKDMPSIAEVQESLKGIAGLTDPQFTLSGQKHVIIRSQKISEETRQSIIKALVTKYPGATQERFDDIGPTVGSELKNKSVKAVIILLIVIVAYISIVFRSMGRVLSPYAMGVAAIAALLHDVIIPVGVFSLLGYYAHIEITAVFVAAALTILGYSVSDTVVVFDRIRENVIRYGSRESFGDLVHKSVMQTLTRSINTSMTTLLSLFAIFFFGGESIKYFALALIIGIISGTYSSIFVASPIIMWWHSRSRGKSKTQMSKLRP